MANTAFLPIEGIVQNITPKQLLSADGIHPKFKRYYKHDYFH